MFRPRYGLIAILSLAIGLTLFASPANAAPIRGFVVDASSLEPLPRASVKVLGTSYGAVSNTDGYFVVNGVPEGAYSVTISYLGYATITREVIVDGNNASLKIELERKGVELKSVQISSKRSQRDEELRATPRVSTVPVEAKLIKTLPSFGGEMDVLRAIQILPGVKASSDINSSLYIRGGSPDMTLIQMDHCVVYNPSHMFGLFSTFNADAVKHIDLIKGAFPAEYGGRAGSVLDVTTNEGNRNQSQGLASVGIVSAKVAYEGPLPNSAGSYALSARRTYFDPILSAMRKAMDTDLPDYYFWDGNGKVNLDLTDRTTFTVAGYAGDDAFDVQFGPKEDRGTFHLDWGNQTYTGRVRHVLSQDAYLSSSLSYSRYASHWNVGDQKVTFDQAEDLMQDYTWKADAEYYGFADHRIKAGLQATDYKIHFHEWTTDVTRVNVDSSAWNYAVYLQDSWRLGLHFELQPGLRIYYHDPRSQYYLDPRLSAVYYYDDRIRFKLAGGHFSQFMNLITFGEGFSNFDIWIPVDASMKPPATDQVVAGFEWDREDGYNVTVEGYYTDMDQITAFDPMTDQGGKEAGDAFVVGRGYAYGAEFLVEKKLGSITGMMGYTLSWTKRQFPNTLINDGNWFYPKWDRRHDFIVAAAYPLNDRWELSADWRFNTGQGFTKYLGLYTERLAGSNPSDYGNVGRFAQPGSMNNYRFPADHRLDIAASYKHQFFWGLPAKLNISIYNAYSRRSYWLYTADTEKLTTDYVKLLPIIPMASYEVRF